MASPGYVYEAEKEALVGFLVITVLMLVLGFGLGALFF